MCSRLDRSPQPWVSVWSGSGAHLDGPVDIGSCQGEPLGLDRSIFRPDLVLDTGRDVNAVSFGRLSPGPEDNRVVEWITYR